MRWRVMVAVVVLALAGCGRAAPSSAPPASATGPVVADPGGLGSWAVRSWQRVTRFSFPASYDTCIQVGLQRGSGLVRVIAGRTLAMKLGDRAVCGSVSLRHVQAVDVQNTPLLIERINVHGSDFTDASARTVVAGILPSTITAVTLSARGRRVPVTTQSRAFLAVLPGGARRRDLVLRFASATGAAQRIDFATGTTGTGMAPLVPRSLRTVLRMRTPLDPRPLQLTVYRVRFSTIHGPVAEWCAEPGEVIGAEAGAYNPRWRDFLDAPTLVSLPGFSSGLGPIMPAAQNTAGCLDGIADYSNGPVGGLGARRISPRLLLIYGFLEPGVAGLRVTAPDNSSFAARVDPLTRAVLIPVRARGVRGERVLLSAEGGHPHQRSARVATGPVPTAMPFRFALRDRSQTVRVSWVDSDQPFIGVRITRTGGRTAISVLDLYPPTFAPDGTPYAIASVALLRCADIHLSSAVSRATRFIDAATQRPVRATRLHLPRTLRCTSVRPGQSVYVTPRP